MDNSTPSLRAVPAKVESLLQEIRAVGNPADVDDPQSGLRTQYRKDLLQEEELLEILQGRRKMKMLIDQGIFK